MAKGEHRMQLVGLDALAFEFFREFSRCEYCLKAVGYRQATRDAKPDWNALARQLESVFLAPTAPELVAAVTYFLENPPKKQIVEDGALGWEDRLPDYESQAELLLLLVSRVRNNLFHGGKFNGRWFEPERSEDLLAHGLAILAACTENDELMNEAYNQKAL